MSDFKFPSNVELRVLDGKGRSLFVTQPVKKGEIIFEEDPLVMCQFAWNKQYKYLACEFCLRPLETVEQNVFRLAGNKFFSIPFTEYDITDKDSHCQCETCGELYCSDLCRLSAWNQYHNVLCHKDVDSEPLAQLVDSWKELHGPPETLNIMLLVKILVMIQLSENKEAMYNTFMQFCHSSINRDENISHLILQEKFRCHMDKIWPIFSSAMLTICPDMNNNPYTASLLTKEGFIRLLTLVGRNNQGIGSSSLGYWSRQVYQLDLPSDVFKKLEEEINIIYDAVDEHVSCNFTDNEGSGLYVVQSCINHSCSPNSKIKLPYSNSKLVVRAMQDLMPGTEIMTSYITKCERNRSCHSRRKYLRDNYMFTCLCTKCIEDSSTQLDVTSDDEEFEDDSSNCHEEENQESSDEDM